MQVSEKIALAMIAWIPLSISSALSSDLEIWPMLVLVGLLMIRELADSFMSKNTKGRVDLFIYTFMLAFALLVISRISQIIS